MIKIDTIDVWGFEGALYGCRMPFESHANSDSDSCMNVNCSEFCSNYDTCPFDSDSTSNFSIGKNDMKLCKKLIRGGSEHRKFLRMIHVQAEVNAPRYFWHEASTYKFMEQNSSSTMHLITKRKLTKEDFSFDSGNFNYIFELTIVNTLNRLIDSHNEETDKKKKDIIFKQIKTYLPEGFMQRRVIDTNYEELLTIYRQRKNHKLTEWSGEKGFCDWLKSLPYMDEFISAMEGKE